MDRLYVCLTLIPLVLVLVLLVGSAPVAAEAAQQHSGSSGGSTDVTFRDANQSVGEGNATTYDIIIESAPNGVSNYSYEINISDPRIASITGFSFAGGPTQRSTAFGSSNDSVTVTANGSSIPAGTNLTIGTVTLTGTTPGSTMVEVKVTQLTNATNGFITAGTKNGVLRVSGNVLQFAKRQHTVANGATTTYDVVLGQAPNGISTYSYDITVGNTSTAKITDFNFAGSPSQQVEIYGPQNGSLEVTGAVSSITPGNNVTVGTVTVSAINKGATSIGIVLNQLYDLNNDKITPAVSNGSISVKQRQATFRNRRQKVSTGGTTGFDVILTSAPQGVSTYSYKISTNNTNAAIITGFQFAGTPNQQTISYGASNASVTVYGSVANIPAGTNVSIGTVMVSGANSGKASIGLQITQLIDLNGGFMTYKKITNGSINITSGPGDLTGNGKGATDPNGDGEYEDINGDGTADLRDLQPYFNLVKPGSGSLSNPNPVDFNGDGQADLRDLKPFFNEVKP